MSRSGEVMTRVVKPLPAAEYPPTVVPAPMTSSCAVDVVTAPLFAELLLPDAEVPTSNGLTGSRPLYSRARRSTYGVAVLKVTVTLLVPAPADLMFLA